ncbi:ATPase, T2SS/T4P/T4SS family [Rothia dentocariosa]|uniref:CpaF family protein n=1 Tax=Rothia dentocariosa TaxID=2047 RepID=UPI0028E2438F|nr:ATPase, T2SS/T4P/T4SS family [Rothia dentocariosa]
MAALPPSPQAVFRTQTAEHGVFRAFSRGADSAYRSGSAETAGTDGFAPEQTDFVTCGNYAPPETLSIVGTCMPPQELMAPDFSAETRERLGLTPIPVFEDHRARRIARHAFTYLLARPPSPHAETDQVSPAASADSENPRLWSSKDLTLAVQQACEEEMCGDENHEFPVEHEPDLVSRALSCLHAELYGLGALETLTHIPGITDIYVNSPQDVWVQAHGQTQPVTLTFETEAQVRQLANRLIRAHGGRLDAAHPADDVHDDSGRRIHAVIPPLVENTHLSIRLPAQSCLTLTALRESGMFDAATEQALRTMIARRQNFVVSGGTGTGKTTLLNALLGECEAWERLMILEDTPELSPQHPHTVSLKTRAANAEGAGEITLGDLLVQALRMAPDRLMVGECRGSEILHLLNAMNTGHQGAGTTLHANSAFAVPHRLAALGALAGLDERTVALHASTAFDRIIHLEQVQGVRRVAGIYRLDLRQDALVVTPCGPAGELLVDGGSTADNSAGGALPGGNGENLPPSSPTDAASPDTYAAHARSTAVQPAHEHRGAHPETPTAPTACTYGYDPGVRTDSDVPPYTAAPREQTDRSSQEGEEL